MDIGAIFNTILVDPMMAGLKWFALLTGSGGMAIIIFTVAIRILLLPLSIYQSKSQKKMMALQPVLKEVQRKHGKDREQMTQETMRVYKEHGVNPASGCLPLVLQLPVLYGLYFALINLGTEGTPGAEEFRQPFLWMPNLALPDAFPLPGFESILLPGPLPLFMAATQFMMSKMMAMPSADPQMQSMNRMMTYMMPLMLLVFSVSFPAGLVLYWTVSNIFSVVQQGFITGWGPLFGREMETATVAPTGSSSVQSNGSAPAPTAGRAANKSSRGAKGKRRGKR